MRSPNESQRGKALIVGPDFFQYNEAIARAFQHHGFSSEIVESPAHNPKGLLNRIRIDLAGQFGIEKYRSRWQRDFNRRVLEKAMAMDPDFILIIKGDWIDPDYFENIRARRKIIWFQDEARRCGANHLRLAHQADFVFVFENDDRPYLVDKGVLKERIHFLPMGFDSHVYKLENMERPVDVSFVGRMYPHREILIERLISDLPDVKFEVFGRYVRYKEPRTWMKWIRRVSSKRLRRIYRNRDIDPERVNLLYNQSKIVLNIHHGQSRDGCNPRVFEIMGSGAFQICDANPYVERHFPDSIVRFGSAEELVEKIEFFLSSPSERDSISLKALSAGADHSFNSRIEELLRVVAEDPDG